MKGELCIGIVNFDKHTANGQERERGFREEAEKDSRVKEIVTINVASTTEEARSSGQGTDSDSSGDQCDCYV